MKKTTLMLLALVFALISHNLVNAQESFTHPDAKVTITVPGGWFYETSGHVLTMYPKSKDLGLAFNIMDASGIDAAVQKAVSDINTHFPGATVTGPTPHDVNGMTGFSLSGSATDGTQFGYSLIVTPAGKVMEIGFAAKKDAVDKYLSDITTIVNGIQPAH